MSMQVDPDVASMDRLATYLRGAGTPRPATSAPTAGPPRQAGRGPQAAGAPAHAAVPERRAGAAVRVQQPAGRAAKPRGLPAHAPAPARRAVRAPVRRRRGPADGAGAPAADRQRPGRGAAGAPAADRRRAVPGGPAAARRRRGGGPARADSRGEAYLAFEDLHRGTREEIKRRQSVYLPHFQISVTARAPLLDLGCGRGEFLDLCRENSLPAMGVDVNPAMVAACRERGLDVAEGDGLAHLRTLPDASLGGILLSQVVEHLSLDQLTELVALCAAKLVTGGALIAETVNPTDHVRRGLLRRFDPHEAGPPGGRPLPVALGRAGRGPGTLPLAAGPRPAAGAAARRGGRAGSRRRSGGGPLADQATARLLAALKSRGVGLDLREWNEDRLLFEAVIVPR